MPPSPGFRVSGTSQRAVPRPLSRPTERKPPYGGGAFPLGSARPGGRSPTGPGPHDRGYVARLRREPRTLPWWGVGLRRVSPGRERVGRSSSVAALAACAGWRDVPSKGGGSLSPARLFSLSMVRWGGTWGGGMGGMPQRTPTGLHSKRGNEAGLFSGETEGPTMSHSRIRRGLPSRPVPSLPSQWRGEGRDPSVATIPLAPGNIPRSDGR